MERQERIINLAHELLCRNGLDDTPCAPQKAPLSHNTFLAICLASFIAGSSGVAITSWTYEKNRALNHYERTEIEALIYYAIHKKGLDQGELHRDIVKTFGRSIDSMSGADFPDLRRFLQEKAG